MHLDQAHKLEVQQLAAKEIINKLEPVLRYLEQNEKKTQEIKYMKPWYIF